jgi:hypothetical protein
MHIAMPSIDLTVQPALRRVKRTSRRATYQNNLLMILTELKTSSPYRTRRCANVTARDMATGKEMILGYGGESDINNHIEWRQNNIPKYLRKEPSGRIH